MISGTYLLLNRFGNVIRRGTFEAPTGDGPIDTDAASFEPALPETVRDTDRLELVWAER